MAKQTTVSPLLKPNEGEQFTPQSITKKVEIIYGANDDTFEIIPGTTFNEILADSKIRETLGFSNIKNDASVWLAADGERVTGDYVFKGTEQRLEILKKMGEKA